MVEWVIDLCYCVIVGDYMVNSVKYVKDRKMSEYVGHDMVLMNVVHWFI